VHHVGSFIWSKYMKLTNTGMESTN